MWIRPLLPLMPRKSVPELNPTIERTIAGEVIFNIKSNISSEPFARQPLSSMQTLADIKDWTGAEARLFFALVGSMDYAGCVELTPGQLAERLETSPTQISRAIAGLIEKDLVTKYRFMHRTYWLMVNPIYVRRCRDKDFSRILDEYEEARNIMLEREGGDRYSGSAALHKVKREGSQRNKATRAAKKHNQPFAVA